MAQKKKNKSIDLFSDDIIKMDSDINDKLKLVIKAGNSNNIENERAATKRATAS